MYTLNLEVNWLRVLATPLLARVPVALPAMMQPIRLQASCVLLDRDWETKAQNF